MAEEPFAASAEQLGEEEQLVRRYLKEARKADRCWTGYLDSEDALKEFDAKQKGCILPIELECPFRILSKRTKGCVFGLRASQCSLRETCGLGYALQPTTVTEAQNKMLKERYLKSESGRRSLTGLIQTLRTFQSDREQHFHRENLKVSSDYRHYHDAVPEYLHNRPRSVVLHIMSRLAAAGDIDQKSVTPGPCQGTFMVKSSSSEEVSHCVDFTEPSCTCRDFRKQKPPCKHFCAIFLSDKNWGFDKLP
ncbi:hypothetical protein HPB51_028726 [Rhipicephalus microplus]|uniref:SWIM-type domain-containing protein n=1 Tax=Rhipicephalus microplus TaxID=6941 RepID=A0A9J6CWH9_RHIMP|nr:hypothetical protein HPB51_028726 [Rhipicephalus microplus]